MVVKKRLIDRLIDLIDLIEWLIDRFDRIDRLIDRIDRIDRLIDTMIYPCTKCIYKGLNI